MKRQTSGSNDIICVQHTVQCEDIEQVAGPRNVTKILKPAVISRYVKYMGGVVRGDYYCGGYAFLRKTSKRWRKMFFWPLEVAKRNSFILINLSRKQQGLKKMRHKEFCKYLVIRLVGDVQNKFVQNHGKNSDANGLERLSGKHFIAKISNGIAKDCAVCSDQKVKRMQTVYHCETCERQPGLHSDTCIKKYHTEQQYKQVSVSFEQLYFLLSFICYCVVASKNCC